MTPDDRKYANTHEWVLVEGDTATVGITDHAQQELGDITFVELPDVGATVVQARECGVVESVKAASDLYAPLSGDVVDVNHTLNDKPETINASAFGDGWIFKLQGFDVAELDNLLSAAEYEHAIGENG